MAAAQSALDTLSHHATPTRRRAEARPAGHGGSQQVHEPPTRAVLLRPWTHSTHFLQFAAEQKFRRTSWER